MDLNNERQGNFERETPKPQYDYTNYVRKLKVNL